MRECQRRLQKEFRQLRKDPVPLVLARPDEKNFLIWHYLFFGPFNTPFEGGEFIGTLEFPASFPYAPPHVRMSTPSGRFKPGAKICMSLTAFHPEKWSPMWRVGAILNALLSFMTDKEFSTGCVQTSDETKQNLARKSTDFNEKNGLALVFGDELVEERAKYRRMLRDKPPPLPPAKASSQDLLIAVVVAVLAIIAIGASLLFAMT
eukprot:CAMPEP_0119140536 /NCGR_PEP_ID=MMETSP1310-20130426/29387_1 /TAXON_ID=464262 /ORGANISM="Genus nov. species nov., Strain RCC2339" /LENGTH=205 /DNA_ID=CAMNT_0007131893 /DNA_START=231 /DNA_END=848 /DNA_ORIENTATION=+